MAVPSRRFLSGGEIESGCLYVPKIGLMLELGNRRVRLQRSAQMPAGVSS